MGTPGIQHRAAVGGATLRILLVCVEAISKGNFKMRQFQNDILECRGLSMLLLYCAQYIPTFECNSCSVGVV